MELQEINRRIAGIKGRVSGARIAIQEVAVGIIEHANEHGDCTAAARLLRVMDPKNRPQAARYFTLFSPIKVVVGKTAAEDAARFRKVDQNGYNPFNIDGARAHNWWEVEGEKKPEATRDLNLFRSDFQKFVKRWEKAMSDGKVPEGEAESIKLDIAEFHKAALACGSRQNTPLREAPLQAVVNG